MTTILFIVVYAVLVYLGLKFAEGAGETRAALVLLRYSRLYLKPEDQNTVCASISQMLPPGRNLFDCWKLRRAIRRQIDAEYEERFK